MAFSLFRRGRAPSGEARAAFENPQTAEAADQGETRAASIGEMVRQSDPGLLQFFGFPTSAAGEAVTIDSALKVPAVLSAVTFLARTQAALPQIAYSVDAEGNRKENEADPLGAILNRAANDESTAFAVRQEFWTGVFTVGRGVAFIERDGAGRPINLWNLEAQGLTVGRSNGRIYYKYRDGVSREVRYTASDVLDIRFMPTGGGLSTRSPIFQNADIIGLGLAVTKYGARFFNNGGVPPFAISGPIKTAAGVQRAADDMTKAVQTAANNNSNALAIPEGHKLEKLGVEPDKMQMIAAQKFLVEQIARVYGLPPAFLQYLENATFSNVEQQDLALVKHLVSHWAKAWDQEANLKLYGRAEAGRVLETELDGIMRGDLKTISESWGKQINTGQATVNEIRKKYRRPPVSGGDAVFIQGAMATVESLAQGKAPDPAAPAPADDTDDDETDDSEGGAA